MAENDKKPSSRLTMHSIDPDDFIRFLAEKAGDHDPCWVCKADDWVIMCANDGPTYRFGIPSRNVEKTFYASVFMYYCQNCGFLRQHISKVVNSWVEENPANLELDLGDDQGVEHEGGENV
ncbi:hypothetical protein NUH87_26645 [Pseudomonas batumici]|uniref:hypothetical protein n=1 Tax=Pseudomonas batumici TaxID=226910 RepID=UPI0030D2DAD9